MTYDTRRHDVIFDHKTFKDPIHIIGVGGIGGRVAELLIRFGCGLRNELHVWDGDTVAPHNPPNQVYGKNHVGMYKTEALAQLAKEWTGAQIHEHREFVDGHRPFKGVVFACLDSMRTRKAIWENCIKQHDQIVLFVETRMDATHILTHVIDPNNASHIEQWERYWYPDEQADNLIGGCGGHIAIPTTVVRAASDAVWEMVRFHAIRNGDDDLLNNQLRVDMVSHEVQTFQW